MANSSLIASIAQIALSAALVIVTYFYWQETQNQTTEMERTRELEFQPVVRGTLREWIVNHWLVEITNTGKGAAYDLEIDFYFDEVKTLHWRTPQLAPGESTTFQVPIAGGTTNKDELLAACKDTNGVLVIESSCYSAIDKEERVEEHTEIPIAPQLRKGKAPGVKEKDEEIEYYKEQREIARNIMRKSVLDEIRSHSEITYGRLETLTGFQLYYLRPNVLSLYEAGIIDLEIENPEEMLHIPRQTVIRYSDTE